MFLIIYAHLKLILGFKITILIIFFVHKISLVGKLYKLMTYNGLSLQGILVYLTIYFTMDQKLFSQPILGLLLNLKATNVFGFLY